MLVYRNGGKIVPFCKPKKEGKILFLADNAPQIEPFLKSKYPNARVQTKIDVLWDEAEAVVMISGITSKLCEMLTMWTYTEKKPPLFQCGSLSQAEERIEAFLS